MISGQDEVPVIDTLHLAYYLFHYCRHDNERSGLRRDLLVSVARVLIHARGEVRRTGNLEVEAPTSSLAFVYLRSEMEIDPLAARTKVADLNRRQQRLLELTLACADELARYCLSSAPVALLSSLGYALHSLPALVRNGRFDATQFRFNFRVAAFAWPDLSVEMTKMLCELVEVSIDQAQEWISSTGFALKM
jgi:hypothetical protein